METLFPAFQVPVFNDGADKAENLKYRPSYDFDFSTGEFVTNAAGHVLTADGHEAYKQWCIKVLMTERYSRIAYSSVIGSEFDDAMDQPNIGGVMSAVERTITETLMVNKKTERVTGFEFIRLEPDTLYVYFEVHAINMPSFSIILKEKEGERG